MGSDFRPASIGEIAAPIPNATAAGPFGSNLVSRDYVESGVPVIRGQNLADRWIGGEFVYVSQEKAATLRTNTARPGDIVFTQRGTLGQVSLVPADAFPVYVISQSQMKLTVDPARADSGYVYYACTSSDFIRQVHDNAVAAGVPHINLGTLRGLRIPLPSLEIQKTIAGTLATLDDRINLLRQTNTTLEAIAQALFKSWFVDFDPVHAKAEGREPEAIDAATAALFPSEFEESELGPIPQGWQVATLSEHVDAERGLSYKGAGLTSADDGLPMHNLNSVLEGGGYKYAGIKYYNAAYKERHLVKAGDIIVANTEQGHHHRLIGFPAIVPHQFTNGIFSHHLYRVRAKKGSPVSRHWLYYCLMTSAVRDQIIGCSNGSTVNMLKPAGLQIPQMVVPPAKLCRAFGAIAEDLRTKIEGCIDRAETLAQLRDTLLPRLISGKLRIPEAIEVTEGIRA